MVALLLIIFFSSNDHNEKQSGIIGVGEGATLKKLFQKKNLNYITTKTFNLMNIFVPCDK